MSRAFKMHFMFLIDLTYAVSPAGEGRRRSINWLFSSGNTSFCYIWRKFFPLKKLITNIEMHKLTSFDIFFGIPFDIRAHLPAEFCVHIGGVYFMYDLKKDTLNKEIYVLPFPTFWTESFKVETQDSYGVIHKGRPGEEGVWKCGQGGVKKLRPSFMDGPMLFMLYSSLTYDVSP